METRSHVNGSFDCTKPSWPFVSPNPLNRPVPVLASVLELDADGSITVASSDGPPGAP